MRLWVWRNLRIRLPADWEMLQFSRNQAAGNCAFADWYRYRLEFSWKSVDGRPDLKRLVTDYCSKLKVERQMPDARPIEAGGWRGLTGHIQGSAHTTLTTRFCAYNGGESCLVELVFTWPDGRDKRLEKTVLKSVRTETVRYGPPRAHRPERTSDRAADGYRRWKAFGMDLLASAGLELGECKVEPANVCMEFRDPNVPARKERFQRLGMVPHWLRLPLGKWLERSLPREVEVRSRTSDFVLGHKIEAVRGLMPTKWMSKLLGRKNSLEAAAWICPVDGRLYFSRIDAAAKAGVPGGPQVPADEARSGLGLAGGRLSCCPELSPAM